MNGPNSEGAALLTAIGLFAIAGVIHALPWSDIADIAMFLGVACGLPVVGAIWAYGIYRSLCGWVERKRVHSTEERQLLLEEMERKAAVEISMNRSQLVTVEAGQQVYGLQDIIRGVIRDEMSQLQAAYYDSQRTHPNVPNHISYRTDSKHTGQIEQPPPESLPQLKVPNFSNLYHSGMLRNGEILVGFDVDTNEPVYSNWNEIYSSAISGKSRTGKSTTVRNMLAQVALSNARFVIVDRQAGHRESLAKSLQPLNQFMAVNPASTDEDILSAISYVQQIGKSRIDNDEIGYPLMLVIDEFTALVNRSGVGGQVAEVVEEIAQEYAKTNVFCMAIGQIWSAKRTGGSADMRDSFSSAIVHRTKRQQARYLIDTDNSKIAEKLPQGQCLFEPANGDIVQLQVPNCTLEDIEHIFGNATRSSDVLNAFPGGNIDVLDQVENAIFEDSERNQNANGTQLERVEWTSLELRIADMLKRKHGYTEIYNVLLKGQMSKQKAWEFIADVIAKGMNND